MVPAGLIVVAYGKFGGYELGYGSDLDLVFLHDSAGDVERTTGPVAVENSVFFLRLVQRIVHLLTVHSAAGRLYEVDTRLRPSGKGGLLAQSIAGFEQYQRADAWTWEHQALLRARAVAGPPALRERFETVRVELLRSAVRRDTLRAEVRAMRERMRAELVRTSDGEFDLKQDHGGIADIEFLAQYWTLKWSERFAELVTFPDVIRQLESLASIDLVPQATVDVLTGAYRAYRQRIHHLSLESGGSLVPSTEFTAERAAVSGDLAGDDGRLRRHLRAAYNPGPESRGCAMTELLVPISPGELIDKITILEIKSQRMRDAVKLANVRTELALLMDTWQASPWSAADIAAEWADLRAVNEKLWVVEDEIRDKERDARFDQGFIELARAVYVTNDERAAIKKRINTRLGSTLVEEKSYADYQRKA